MSSYFFPQVSDGVPGYVPAGECVWLRTQVRPSYCPLTDSLHCVIAFFLIVPSAVLRFIFIPSWGEGNFLSLHLLVIDFGVNVIGLHYTHIYRKIQGVK